MEYGVSKYPKVEGKLNYIEEEYDVEIVLAMDFGSHAWNLDSDSSDKDVAFIFKQDTLDYAKINNYRENIDRHFEFDGKKHTFMGWNLKRFMEMAGESNPSAIEFLNSPITYKSPESKEIFDVFVDLKKHVNQNFKPIGMFYHYRSMGQKNYRKYIQSRLVNDRIDQSFPVVEENEEEIIIDVSEADDIYGRRSEMAVTQSQAKGKDGGWHRTTLDRSVKRHLYAVRALLYARYVAETHQVPPLNFPEFLDEEVAELVEKDVIPAKVLNYAKDWADKKKSGKGSEEVGNPLKNWIEDELSFKLDNPEHNIRGTEKEEVNKVIEKVLDS